LPLAQFSKKVREAGFTGLAARLSQPGNLGPVATGDFPEAGLAKWYIWRPFIPG
jgi:hypothetical protein